MTAKVLYVDDEADIREVATMALELDPALEVRSCGSGEEALRIAPEWRPDLILLDVMMPVMDGPTTLARLRSLDSVGNTKVVFITARAQSSDVDRLRELGAQGIIPKPFDPMSLAEEVRKYL